MRSRPGRPMHTWHRARGSYYRLLVEVVAVVALILTLSYYW